MVMESLCAKERYDVAILGSGLGGAMLAAILAKQGHSVLLLEKGTHPRFAIGEAMLPQSSMLMWILGERFGVPEIQHLSNSLSIRQHVSASCGVKRTIGFLYHEEGRRQNPAQSHLLVPPATPLFSESHLYRQDVDLYMVNAAIRHGAVYRERIDVNDLELRDDEVVLRSAAGEEFHARFLVDGTGHKSLLAETLGLREKPTRLRTQSRSIFTHLKGVKAYDDCLRPDEHLGLSARWYEGTLHHVFDGGWFWVIPFDNHGDKGDAVNPLCSVGLTLDMRKFPDRGLSPEQEFREIVARFPSVAAHFEGAEAVRPWISTGRLQYSSTRSAGDRWFLLAHAAGFVDALYSRGLISTFETILALVDPLMQSLREDRFTAARFAYPERLQAALLDANDRMVNSSYQAFGHFPLWNAWVRLWLSSTLFGDLRLFRLCLKYLETRDGAVFDSLQKDPLPRTAAPGENLAEDLLDAGEALLAAVQEGVLSAGEAAERIFELLHLAPLPPVHGWSDPEQLHLDFTPEKLMRMIGWGKTEAPAELRDRMFDFNMAVLGGMSDKAHAPARTERDQLAMAMA
jgi:FADH2 O2-dependent halogenase